MCSLNSVIPQKKQFIIGKGMRKYSQDIIFLAGMYIGYTKNS